MTGVWMKLTVLLANTYRGNLMQHPKAQVSIELTAALIGCILLLAGILKIFYWINQSIIDQQVAYQSTRINATASFNYTPRKLDLFK